MIFSLLALVCVFSDPKLWRFVAAVALSYYVSGKSEENGLQPEVVMAVLSGGSSQSNINCCDLITGTYTYSSSINFENYLRQLGVAYWLRQLAMLAHPVVTVKAKNCSRPEKVDCIWEIETSTLVKNHVVSFRIGETVADTTMDGRDITFKMEQPHPNQFVETQYYGKNESTKITRTFSESTMKVTLEANGVIAASSFTRQNHDDFADEPAKITTRENL